MKKRRLWLVVLSLIISICACFCIAACSTTESNDEGDGGNDSVTDSETGSETGDETGGDTVLTKLETPENLTATIQGEDEGKVILSWNAVEGAGGYGYIINGDEENAVTVEESSAAVDLSEIDATKLDSTWTFQIKALGSATAGTSDGDYCEEVEFSISHDEIYTVAEILKIMNYYGENLPRLEFWVEGTIETNTNGNAVLESGFTLFGEYVPELYLAIDERLAGFKVTAIGTLAVEGDIKGLSSYRAVEFEDIEEADRYALVIETLSAWDLLKEDSKIMDDFYLPVELYGVSIMWTVDDEDTGAFALDAYGNVTITCPAVGEEDIPVMLSVSILYIGNDEHMYYGGDEPSFMFYITSDSRTELAAPKININATTGVATWNEVEHAVGYRYNLYGVIDDDYINWETKSVDITGYINVGEKLEVQMYNKLWLKVQAIGDGVTYKDSEADPKQYNYYPETTEPDGTPLVFDLTKITSTGELQNPTSIFKSACNNASVFESATASRVNLGNDDANGAVTGTGFIKVGSKSNDGNITLNFNKKIMGVVITACQWNSDKTDKISVNGSTEQTASKYDWGTMYFNFTASKASETVEIKTNNRVFIKSITVYVAD